MTSLFPDVNVWLALSMEAHSHSDVAWNWLSTLRANDRLILCRYTQLGLLRLLTNASVMGGRVLTIKEAWSVYDRWLHDARVEARAEPLGVDAAFRTATEPLSSRQATNAIGDCYLLAFASQTDATLVTFDSALYAFARKRGYAAVRPA